MAADRFEIVLVRTVLEHHVATQAEVGAVELEDQSSLDDRLVFRSHRFGERFEIGIVAWVEIVRLEQRYDPWGGCVHEPWRASVSRSSRGKSADIVLERREGQGRHLAHAARSAVARRASAFGLAFEETGEGLQVRRSTAGAVTSEAADPVLDVGRVA